ncbi:MAG: EAL domain-containing protein [Wenzhouxiangellaceae bacterium]
MLHALATESSEFDVLSHLDEAVDAGFSFAFQPILSLETSRIVAHEALVRGLGGESSASVIAAIRPENRVSFDQACRIRALAVAAQVGVNGDIHLNCSQISSGNLEQSLRTTRDAALKAGIHPRRVVLEFGNLELLGDPRSLDRARHRAHEMGMRVLADNIGISEVGLKRLAVFRPDQAKLDRSIVRGINSSPRRQAIVLGILATCRALGIKVIAGGVELSPERDWLAAAGVTRAQGYLFARPAFEWALERPPARLTA